MNTQNFPEIDSLWDYDHPKETEQKFRDLLSVVNKSDHKSYYTELLTQLARTQGLQRKFQNAHELLDTVDAYIKEENMPIPEIRYLLERGRTFNSANENEKAIVFFKEAYDKALKIKEDFYAIDAAHMLGIAENLEYQLIWNIKAMELSENSLETKSKKWLGALYNNIGWTLFDMKEYIKALELFEKSLAWKIEQNDRNVTYIAKWCIGRVYRSLNRIDDAYKIQYDLLMQKEDAYVYEEIGECLFLKDKKEDAKKYFSLAYNLLSQDEWLKENEPTRIERLYQLSL